MHTINIEAVEAGLREQMRGFIGLSASQDTLRHVRIIVDEFLKRRHSGYESHFVAVGIDTLDNTKLHVIPQPHAPPWVHEIFDRIYDLS